MRRLITLVSHSDNAPVVRAELLAIDGQYGQYGAQKPYIPNVPCPYTASLLGSAWTTDLEAGQEMYTSGVTLEQSLLPAWMGCWDGDNNDGISILDVTEPDRPAYCFLRSEGVLNAHQYLNAYYHIGEYKASLPEDRENESPKTEEVDNDTEGDTDDEGEYRYQRDDSGHKRRLLQAVQALDGVPIIRADQLREAWPKVRFRDAASTATVVPEVDIPLGPLSLTDLTLDVAVKHALDTEDTSDLERLIWLPAKAGEIKQILRDLSPFPDSGTQLLTRVLSELKEETRVDLSAFQLSGAQLVQVVSGYSEIAFLNVSFNSILISDDIPKLLEVIPTLRRLVVMGCSSVLDAHILSLVQNEPSRFKSLEGLLHPAFLTIEKPEPYPTAFTFVNFRGSGNLACASMPFFTPAQVVQALIDVLPWRDAKSNRDIMDASLPLVGCSAFHGGARAPDEKFSQRAVVSVPFLSPRIPRGQTDFWVFVASRPSKFSFGMTKPMWGFVHFTRSEDEPATAAASPASSTDNENAPTPTRRRTPARPLECSGQLYDLRGFLECMESEGRPMPSDAAVKELERILYKKHRKTGEFYCPFMTKEDAHEIEPTGSDRLFGERYDDMGFRS
ncbi:hypothetical protein GSI_00346 [Ganoderma sinense ZZ0214-1]|uniref:Uncharacterized protein n=1 Tax=Ganoderma sinense ZZ0214-1 TaxID=1077348 RepID=A0A2G8SSB0_9APHY|nr:hypothetical protein GSI_00346 [Ganoderma sinense ZZ0214-1]